MHELRIVRRGRRRLIPVRELERWLEENAAVVLQHERRAQGESRSSRFRRDLMAGKAGGRSEGIEVRHSTWCGVEAVRRCTCAPRYRAQVCCVVDVSSCRGVWTRCARVLTCGIWRGAGAALGLRCCKIGLSAADLDSVAAGVW